MKPLVIGISADGAKCGKDTFCALLIERLKAKNILAKRYGLADALKNELNPFIQQQFGIDLWNCTPEEKELTRDILVAYGKVKRIQSKGQCWWKLIEEKIVTECYPVCVISDCRYDTYQKDERYFVQDKHKGILVHVKRYDTIGGKKIYFKPPNEDEARENPKLQKASDYIINWETSGIKDLNKLIPHVDDFINFLVDTNYLK